MTDDVREALAEVLYEADIDNNPESQLPESWEETCAQEPGWAEGFRHAADRVRRAFDVCPRGTVPAEQISDAEVEAAGRVLYGISWGDEDLCDPILVRAALEAAREAK